MKQEICRMKEENERLAGEQRMFRNFFFQNWTDKDRQFINQEPAEKRNDLINGTKFFYDVLAAKGQIDDQFGSKAFYLSFDKSQMANMDNNASKKLQQVSQVHQMNESSGMMATAGGPHMNTGTLGGPQMHSTMGGPADMFEREVNMRESSDKKINSYFENEEGNKIMDIFIDGGSFNYQKAKLDLSDAKESADELMFRVNTPVLDNPEVTYKVLIAKKLSGQ